MTGRSSVLAATLCLTGALYAQTSSISGPVEGFLFDAPTRSIRAVMGSLGSASLGPALASYLDFASVAPGRNYGIAVRGGLAVFVSSLGSDQASVAPLSGSAFPPDGVAWSRDGSVAVLYSRAAGRVQAFRGLPNALDADSPFSVASLGGAVTAAAAGPNGQNVAIAVTGDNAGIYQLTTGQSVFSPVAQISDPLAVAFSEDGGTLYALDRATGSLSEIDVATGARQSWPGQISDGVAIQAALDSDNRKVLYVTGGSSHTLQIFDRVTRQLSASVNLGFAPTILEPLGAASFVLRPRASGSDPIWSFADRGQPAIFFVPALPAPPQEKDLRRRMAQQ